MPAKRCPTYPNHRAKANLSDSGRRAKKKIEEKRSECVAPLCPNFFSRTELMGSILPMKLRAVSTSGRREPRKHRESSTGEASVPASVMTDR